MLNVTEGEVGGACLQQMKCAREGERGSRHLEINNLLAKLSLNGYYV